MELKKSSKVKDEDFEECDLIEIEASVFGEWLDKLRDDDKGVGIDLKPGVIGTIVSAQNYLTKQLFNKIEKEVETLSICLDLLFV